VATLLAEDDFGMWLQVPAGTVMQGPVTSGEFEFDCAVLVDDVHQWVAWWVDDPGGRRVSVDVCLPPARTAQGWTFVDLELDPVRHESGLVEVDDEDEFAVACHNLWIDHHEAALARAASERAVRLLIERIEPYGSVGWTRLDGR
jgi:hypothetical protein